MCRVSCIARNPAGLHIEELPSGALECAWELIRPSRQRRHHQRRAATDARRVHMGRFGFVARPKNQEKECVM